MTTQFSFAETHTHVFITFYKPPNGVKSNIPEVVTPEIKLQTPTALLYNSEVIPLYAPVSLVTVENSTMKTEVTLKKTVAAKWNCLNGGAEVPKMNEEIYREDEAESKPNDMMELLKSIYAQGDDDVKRAMNKSMDESQGTVLSTNWKDVGSKKINPEQ